MSGTDFPYDLPIWRRFHRAASPDGRRVAQIDPAYEVSMGNPTYGMLCVSGGPHVERCNPSFLWSDDSQYLAVPHFVRRFGLVTRQRLLIVALEKRRVFASLQIEAYFQPMSFSDGELVVAIDPFHRTRKRVARFRVPDDLGTRFERQHAAWPEADS